MTHFLLVAHAPLASALLAVAQHVFPELRQRLAAVDVQADEGLAEVEGRVSAAARLLLAAQAPKAGEPQAVLALVDVFGATPCKATQTAAESLPMRVVTGVSVPMLWRVLGYAGRPLDELVASAVAGAAQGAIHVSVTPRQNQYPSSGDHDQQHDNDQQ